MKHTDSSGQDEFLKAPLLFKYGPLALMLVGVTLSALSILVAQWRFDEGRKGVYVGAFQSTEAAVVVVRGNFIQVLGQLRQATYNLEALRDSSQGGQALKNAFSQGLGLYGTGIQAVGLSKGGQLVVATAKLSGNLDFGKNVWDSISRKSAVEGAPVMLPAMASPIDGSLVIPLAQRVNLKGKVEFVVYLLDSSMLAAGAQTALAGKQGWLLLEDKQGTTLLEQTTPNVTASRDDNPVRVSSVTEALSGRIDYNSARVLVASAASNEDAFKVTIGLSERDALAEFESRMNATWLILYCTVAFLLMLTGVTGYSLRRFASKEAYLRRLATIDILTDLPNRRSFQELLTKSVAHSLRTGKKLALVFIDLDNFKYVNDSMGHEMGDSLLRHAAAALVGAVRKGDRVCRLGGDEFTVLLGDVTGPEEALQIGERLQKVLLEPHILRGVEIRTKASMGIALSPIHATSEADLMRYADTAMFRAKREGKGCCIVYNESIAAQALLKAQTVSELEKAIERNELFLVYQPKFCLRSGTVTGFEALVRWRHPERGLVFPGDFIPLAEEAGLIVDLGNWVMARAIRQLNEWADEGKGWQKMAVNVSALQLRGTDFTKRVQRLLTETGVPGNCLQVELTESSLAVDANTAQSLVSELRTLGVTVAVDDFGTGYSSLSALKSFEIDYLKVDRSFVMAIHTQQGAAICRAVVSLGHALNMRVVAEGVETADQRDALARLGCDEVQGYLFSKPIAPADAVRFSAGRHPSIVPTRPTLVAA